MMKKRTVFVSIVLILTVLSVSFMYNLDGSNQNFDYSKFFALHEEDMQMLVNTFSEAGSFNSVRRHEALVGKGINYGFSVYTQNDEFNVTYELDADEENGSFWENDAETITSTKGTGQITLEYLLNCAEIDKNFLMFLIGKMKECEVESMGKSSDGNYIRIYVSSNRGYIYYLDSMTSTVYSEGVHLKEKWEFFEE